MNYPYGVHIAVTKIDKDTGAVDIERYLVAYDVGKAVNPMLIEGQIVGGCAQGIGGTLLEEFLYDERGEPLSVTFADYLMPTVREMPTVDVLICEDAPSPLNPMGLKGAGEGGANAVGAAIAAAIDDALGMPRRRHRASDHAAAAAAIDTPRHCVRSATQEIQVTGRRRMDLKLQGKTALVTGGSEGIGKGIALALAKEGVDVAICARRKEPLEAAAKEIARATNRKIVPIPPTCARTPTPRISSSRATRRSAASTSWSTMPARPPAASSSI